MNPFNYRVRALFVPVRVTLLISLLMLVSARTSGQHFHFTQYQYAPLRLNPALIGTQREATAIFQYRHQATNTEVQFNSSSVTAAYPLLSRRNGQQIGGIGISVMDDRTGGGGVFAFQTIGFNAAYAFRLNKDQSLSFGMQGNYANRRISITGVTTGSQYIAGRGFDPGSTLGEHFDPTRNQYFTLGTGAVWNLNDSYDNRKSYAGISIYDLNQPYESFIRQGRVPATLIIHGGVRVWDYNRMTVTPEWLLSHSSGSNYMNVGVQLGYGLSEDRKNSLNLATRYAVGRSANLAIQLVKPNYVVGLSYDFPLNQDNTNTFQAATEVVLAYKLPVKAKNKKKHKKKKHSKKKRKKATKKKVTKKKKKSAARKKTKKKISQVARTPVTKKPTPPKTTRVAKDTTLDNTTTRLPVPETPKNSVEFRKPDLQETIQVLSAPKSLKFKFNSDELDEQSYPLLDKLADALNRQPAYHLQLVGYTDDKGSASYNTLLSRKRAQRVADYLITQGVAPDRLTVEGKGEANPAVPNSNDEQRAINRRVELTVQEK